MVEQEGRHELVGPARRLEGRRQQVVLLHQLAHGADTAALGLGHVHVVQHGGDARVPCLAARLAQLLLGLDRMTRVAHLQPVGVADHLHGAVDAIAAVHHRVDDGLTDHAQWQCRLVLARQRTFGQRKRLHQLVAHRGLGPADGREQRRTDLQRVEAVVGVFHPLPARHADVVDAHHREAAPQRLRRAEQQQAGYGGLEFAALRHGRTHGAQQVLVIPAQLVGAWVGALAQAPVVLHRGRVDVRQVGVGQHRAVEGLHLLAGVQRHQVVFAAFLVGVLPTRRNAPRGRPSLVRYTGFSAGAASGTHTTSTVLPRKVSAAVRGRTGG